MEAGSENLANEEQRKFLKAELRVYHGSSQEEVLSGFSIDISSGGLFLKTDTIFAINDIVMLSFKLPDINKTVNCKAKVAWINSKEDPKKKQFPTGIGLQFIEPSTEYIQSIQSLLKHDGVIPKS